MRGLIWAALFLVSKVVGAAEGPKILYEYDPTLLTTTIEVVLLSGSLDDPPRKNGLVSLMSDMVLRGTKFKDRVTFQGAVERLGATLEVSTTDDMTVFIGVVIKESTIAFMKLLEEALFQPGFSEKEFKALKRERLADIAHIKNSNMRLAGLALRKEVFSGTQLEYPVNGVLSSVKRIELQDVVKVYDQVFRKDTMLFAVASPFQQDELNKRIAKFWLRFPKGNVPQRKPILMKLPQSPKVIVVHKPETSTGSVVFGQAGITARNPLRYALGLSDFSFGAEPLVSRLFKVVRSELGWTYYIGSTYMAMGRLTGQQGIYAISATPSMEHTSKAILKILSMWKDYMGSGLNEDELLLAQDSLVNSYPFKFDSARKRLSLQLHSVVYGVPILSPEEYAKELRGISGKKIKEALKEIHKVEGWVVSLVVDKDVFNKQLVEEQKNEPEAERLKVSRVLTPENIVD